MNKCRRLWRAIVGTFIGPLYVSEITFLLVKFCVVESSFEMFCRRFLGAKMTKRLSVV